MEKKTNFKHAYNELSETATANRLQNMVALFNDICNHVQDYHVKVSKGNRKTGSIPSVSLIPVVDCLNCKLCGRGCYDLRHDVIYPSVQKSRAINSAILRLDIDRFFAELQDYIKAKKPANFRYHVGGDVISRSHFAKMVQLAEATPETKYLLFTKSYGIVNRYLDETSGIYPDNLKIILSDWRGAEFDNRHNLPVSSPVWNNEERGPHSTEHVIMCGGNCAICAKSCGGCWGAKSGQTVLFEAH